MRAMLPYLEKSDFPPLRRGGLETLQVNLGYRCNQRCLHCHVNAGPERAELMSEETVEAVIAFLARGGVTRLDLTGGAPELNPRFRDLVRAARRLGVEVTDRCNLTILLEEGQADLADFLAGEGVGIVASLPCYQEENVDTQRGRGVYADSIEALKMLNARGYGVEKGLPLDLVYNPAGAALPPPQAELEAAYRRELALRHGIAFHHLYTITNMPIRRFGSTLVSRGEFEPYMRLLKESFRPENLEGVMCRSLLSVDWRGYLYDCDFNQMLGLALSGGEGKRLHIRDVTPGMFEGRPITVCDHCYGCTAGQGSSCGGALEA